MIKKPIVWPGDEEEREIPVGVIDPDMIECLADLEEAMAAFDEAEDRKYGEHIHVAELEACEW